MKLIVCQQGTPEWLEARAGAITASRFADAISVLTRASGDKKVGDPTAASDKYACDLAFERISYKPYGEPPKAWVLDRGHTLEAIAREKYEGKFGIMAYESGVVKTDDDWVGYSTDGMVEPIFDQAGQLVECEGLIEIKCPVDTLKVREMFLTGDVSEYRHQMQGGMWLTGARWCDFIMYAPDLANAGQALFVKRIHRDDAFIDDMADKLMRFKERVLMNEALFRRGPTALALAA